MALYLDHIFIITNPGADEADRLAEIGFVEGNANVHPGQGTSNRRFFFNDFTIELVYVSDVDEAANGTGKELGILARSQNVKASPFGIVVRVPEVESVPEFPNWHYTPDYFDGKMYFYVGDNSNIIEEPLCICMPPALPRRQVPSEYANPNWQLTSVDIDVPVEKPSETLKHFGAMDRVRITYGKAHKIIMQFNNGHSNKKIDLSPHLPLTIEF